MKISDDEIVDILPIFKKGELWTLDEIMTKAAWKISREAIMEIIVIAVKKGYMDAINEGENNRYCSTELGRDFLQLWYE